MDLTTVSSHRLARRREDLLLGVGETLLDLSGRGAA